MKLKIVTIAVAALLATAMAYGQDQVINAKIPFQFTANEKVLPAGNYEVSIDWMGALVKITPDTKNKSNETLLPFLTTMAARAHSNATDCDLIFDKVGSKYTLSEVWYPDREGILVYMTKGKHEHHIVHTPLSKKS